MAILIGKDTQVLVQGITGKSGSLQTKVMKEYGTKVVAGVTPGRAVCPSRECPSTTLSRRRAEHRIDAAISFVPAPLAKDAVFEIIDNGIKFFVLTTEGIPDHDVMEIVRYARLNGSVMLGPGTAGLISPGKCKLGAHPPRMYKEGHVGLISKSGALSYEVGKTLTEAGIGQSTVLAIGGGPVWGSRSAKEWLSSKMTLKPRSLSFSARSAALWKRVAKFVKESVTKPVVAMIVSRAAPQANRLDMPGRSSKARRVPRRPRSMP